MLLLASKQIIFKKNIFLISQIKEAYLKTYFIY